MDLLKEKKQKRIKIGKRGNDGVCEVCRVWVSERMGPFRCPVDNHFLSLHHQEAYPRRGRTHEK